MQVLTTTNELSAIDGEQNTNEPWVTKPELAYEHLKCSIRHVEKLVAAGMPSILFGGMRRFKTSEVDAWLEASDHPFYKRAA